ncbi:Protein of unknown function [Gryllus bimaculatus]|nr:Protein of unknown function [Gryllus bimaculatus]
MYFKCSRLQKRFSNNSFNRNPYFFRCS